MPKVGSKANYGWGAKAKYAGRNAIRDYYGEGRYATKAAHIARWTVFCRWLNDVGIRDIAEVTTETVVDYALYLENRVEIGDLARSYAVNLVSTANVGLQALRGDDSINISPREHVGTRVRVRQTPPKGMDKVTVMAAAEKMHQNGRPAEAIVILLCREVGLRKKEGCLIDANKSLAEAIQFSRINVTRGTKGGRGGNVDRWVDVSDNTIGILHVAANIQGTSRSLVPPNSNLKLFISKVNKAWQEVRDQHGLGTIHDLRASFACELYERLTGFPAPVLTGRRVAPNEVDLNARQIIAHTLGHGRPEIAAAYVGSKRS